MTTLAATPTMPAVFLPYQLAWLQDQSNLKVCSKARQTGMTFAESFDAVYQRCTGQRVNDYWYTGADETTAREFMEDVALWANNVFGRVIEIIAGEEYDDQRIRTFSARLPRVVGPNGQVREPRITALTSSPSNFRSKSGDVCLDEMAIHKAPARMWAAATMCANWGGVIRVISTHPETPNLFDELVAMGQRRAAGEPKPLDMPVSLHVIDIDRAIGDGLVERINMTQGVAWTRETFRDHVVRLAGPRADTELFCRTSTQEASYLPYELTRPCVRSGLSGITGDEHLFRAAMARAADGADNVYLGCDVGRVSDRFAVAAIARRGSMLLAGPILSWRGRDFGAMKGLLYRLMRDRIAGTGLMVRRLVIDEAGLGMQLAEELERDFRARAEGVNTGVASVREDMWTRVRARSEERTLGLPDDIDLLSQFAGVRRILTASKHDRYDVDRGSDGHGDEATALALGLMAADQPGGEGGWTKLKGMW